LAESWIVLENRPATPLSLPFPSNPGDSEAIALALTAQKGFLLMDE
jgi:predicted nucleic acid-binding protein